MAPSKEHGMEVVSTRGPQTARVQIALTNVAEPGPNVAITRFDVRREIGSEERYQVLLTVRNYTGGALSVPVTVSLEGETLLDERLALPPNDRVTPEQAKSNAGALACGVGRGYRVRPIRGTRTGGVGGVADP